MSERQTYPAQIFYSEEDGGFIATAPDLPGCSAFGETQEEALAELRPAISAWIEAANAAGNPVPEPSRPKIQSQPSGKILLRIPRSLHAQLIEGAKRESTSLNQHIAYLLTYAVTTNLVTQGFHSAAERTSQFAIMSLTLSTNMPGSTIETSNYRRIYSGVEYHMPAEVTVRAKTAIERWVGRQPSETLFTPIVIADFGRRR
jgi:antitoxin HicB